MIIKNGGKKKDVVTAAKILTYYGYVFTAELLSWCPQFGSNKVFQSNWSDALI